MADVVMQEFGKCPCGSRILITIYPPAVAHEPPVCEKFAELEPDDFLAYVRGTLEIKRGLNCDYGNVACS